MLFQARKNLDFGTEAKASVPFIYKGKSTDVSIDHIYHDSSV